MARRLVDDIRARARAAGRDPRMLEFIAIATIIVAPTDAQAPEKLADVERYAITIGSLAGWSALMQLDLSQLDFDVPHRTCRYLVSGASAPRHPAEVHRV